MPIFEYSCSECSHEFEEWIRGKEAPACPSCGSEELKRLMSKPRVHSAGRKERSVKAAKKRDAGQAKERVMTQREYELSHND